MTDYLTSKIVDYMERNRLNNTIFVNDHFINVNRIQHISFEKRYDYVDFVRIKMTTYYLKIFCDEGHCFDFQYNNKEEFDKDHELILEKWLPKDHPAYQKFKDKYNQT